MQQLDEIQPIKKRGPPFKYASDEERAEALRTKKRQWRKDNADALNVYKKTVYYPAHKDAVFNAIYKSARKRRQAKKNEQKEEQPREENKRDE